MKTVRIRYHGLVRSESGATGVEYGIIAGLVALLIVGGTQLSGFGLDRMFQVVGFAMEDAADTAQQMTTSN
jgi:pilus assembly protein Flp/PilA